MAADIKTREAVNSLLNYDVSDNDDDPFREIDTTIHDPDDNPTINKRKAAGLDNKENADALGLDDEVKIVKKRKPVVKLDEARLLSQPGIPKLRALVRSRSIASKLRLKGKGHEYSDAAKLLSYYQLWLDNLYPRAKFADGLQLVEKVGHGKRMQVMRKEWIDEGKPGYGNEEGNSLGKPNEGNSLNEGKGNSKSSDKQPNAESDNKAHDSIFGNLEEGDDEDLFFADATGGTNHNRDDNNEPDEDELDALLAEQTPRHHEKPQDVPPASIEDEDDDLDALLAEQTTRNPSIEQPEAQEQEKVTLLKDGSVHFPRP